MDQKPKWMDDPAMCNYFDSLPPYVQENIMMSAVNFCSVQELRECAEKIQNS